MFWPSSVTSIQNHSSVKPQQFYIIHLSSSVLLAKVCDYKLNLALTVIQLNSLNILKCLCMERFMVFKSSIRIFIKLCWVTLLWKVKQLENKIKYVIQCCQNCTQKIWWNSRKGIIRCNVAMHLDKEHSSDILKLVSSIFFIILAYHLVRILFSQHTNHSCLLLMHYVKWLGK